MVKPHGNRSYGSNEGFAKRMAVDIDKKVSDPGERAVLLPALDLKPFSFTFGSMDGRLCPHLYRIEFTLNDS